MNVERSATHNIDHGSPVQIIELFRIGHDEVARPKLAYFLFGERNGHDSEWTKFVLETTKSL